MQRTFKTVGFVLPLLLTTIALASCSPPGGGYPWPPSGCYDYPGSTDSSSPTDASFDGTWDKHNFAGYDTYDGSCGNATVFATAVAAGNLEEAVLACAAFEAGVIEGLGDLGSFGFPGLSGVWICDDIEEPPAP